MQPQNCHSQSRFKGNIYGNSYNIISIQYIYIYMYHLIYIHTCVYIYMCVCVLFFYYPCVYIYTYYSYIIYILYIFMCVIHHSHSFLILFFLNSTCPFPKEHPSSSHRIFQASKPSGTGKTLAYLIPAVEHLIKNPPPGVGVLILAPSRPSTT